MARVSSCRRMLKSPPTPRNMAHDAQDERDERERRDRKFKVQRSENLELRTIVPLTRLSWVTRATAHDPTHGNGLSFEVDEFLENFVGCRNDAGVGLEATLGRDHVDKTFSQVDIR